MRWGGPDRDERGRLGGIGQPGPHTLKSPLHTCLFACLLMPTCISFSTRRCALPTHTHPLMLSHQFAHAPPASLSLPGMQAQSHADLLSLACVLTFLHGCSHFLACKLPLPCTFAHTCLHFLAHFHFFVHSFTPPYRLAHFLAHLFTLPHILNFLTLLLTLPDMLTHTSWHTCSHFPKDLLTS